MNLAVTSLMLTLMTQAPSGVADAEDVGGAIRYVGPEADLPLPHFSNAMWNDSQPCELLFENEHIRSVQCTFPPGVGFEPHYYPAHWGYIAEGGVMRLNYGAGDMERVVPKGFSWWSDGVDWHNGVNIGDTTVVYVIIEPKKGL